MRFFVGLHQPCDARHFPCCFISVNRLRTRKSDFVVGDWIMDSGAFSELSIHGHYRHPVAEYAEQVRRWSRCGNMLAAASQDYMCEPFILEKTGLTVAEHQRLTIERYDGLIDAGTGVYILPVLQGFQPAEYVEHIEQYGTRLAHGAWVGVGSVCKRNGKVDQIRAVLRAIMGARSDLKLHGFGLKTTALSDPECRDMLHTADSMAWSYDARRKGRNANDWKEAYQWMEKINGIVAR